jgi:hypothetical protein
MWVLIASFFDVIFDKDWFYIIVGLYILVIVSIIIFLMFNLKSQKQNVDTIKEFEKTLKGGLYHFKCPTCSGIFAVKKTKGNDKKPVKMTCPDCGTIGTIPIQPVCIEEEIPEKKSLKANFKCTKCGEGLTVWAEGTELYDRVMVFSCPFCVEFKTMKKI